MDHRTLDGQAPCFYWKACRRYASVEKQGKSVCRECAERLKGMPYPLRLPSRGSIYQSQREAARDLDMIEGRRLQRRAER